MANYFISACGTLDEAVGSFIVPAGTTIYFFSPPDSLLESRYSDFFMDQLCTELIRPTAEAYVRTLSVEVAPEGEFVPNFIAMGSDTVFRDPTGIYRVGQSSARGPVVRLLDGIKKSLKDLVSGIGENGSIGTHVYWGASRENKGIPTGYSPSQYFNPKNRVGRPATKSGKFSRYRGMFPSSSPRSGGFFLERPETHIDSSDFPQFREFKARLRAGSATLRRPPAWTRTPAPAS